MTTIDQFASVFKSAVKPRFRHEPAAIDRVAIVTDLAGDDATTFSDRVRELLAPQRVSEWELLTGDRFSSTIDLLELVEPMNVDLICCYRNLHSRAWQYPHSLGSHLDVLIQKTAPPVLILPHPEAGYAYARAYDAERRVLAMTDHMTDDNALVNCAAAFTNVDGHLFLAHIEDDVVFDRYIDAISKIDTIDTDSAEAAIRKQLLKNPSDYIDSVRAVLIDAHPGMTVDGIVRFGHRAADYLHLVDELHVNLLVLHGTTGDRLAMHPLSYPLAVELRQIPILVI